MSYQGKDSEKYDPISWRVGLYRTAWQKFRWKIRRVSDFSRKIPVRGISVVVAGRNDNYGGDYAVRLRATLDWNLRHLPEPELIYVEWNRVPSRPSDCEWITERYPLSRCYIVPPEIHNRISDDPVKMPVMEYFAKNVGIRRAATEWILTINSDVLAGKDTLKNLNRLNQNTVYATHYVNIRWSNNISVAELLTNRVYIKNSFSAGSDISAVSGNFILTHRKNWLRATGYDERLKGSRLGVDASGLKQLLRLGLRPMIIGHHYHMDHPESVMNSANPSHGDVSRINHSSMYCNKDGWGLMNYPCKEIARNVWELQPI